MYKFCYGLHCKKRKWKWENLRSVYSSDVDDKHSYEEILDCKMPVASHVT